MKYLVLLMFLVSCCPKKPTQTNNSGVLIIGEVKQTIPLVGQCFRFSHYVGQVLKVYSDNSVRIIWVDYTDKTYSEDIGSNLGDLKPIECDLYEDLKAISKPYVEPVETP